MKSVKIPMRMCLGCNEMKPKKELMRVVINSENEVSIDFTGKKNGRGAYLCKDVHCFEKARKAKRFEKSLKCKIDESLYEVMADELRKETENS
ncbi:MAG: YlxR family protein [Ruminococcus sp.]|nr:YlxR family protein [Ruminococcus sp.]